MSKPLRFAALVRVSTESQEKQGESLRTQRGDIDTAVHQLGGRIVEVYGGQEHATPGSERKELDRLLADAPRDKFDAVMVPHPDRWSRDNTRSKEGLKVLRNSKIRFFVLTTEYDLYNPTANFFLGMSAEIGEYTVALQNEKSINNRIARARRGVPAVGKLPFGRTFDRSKSGPEGWGVDPAKKKMIEDVARRYLAGESLEEMAPEYGISDTQLRTTLMKRCGPVWEQEFASKSLNIHEVVPTPVPELLPAETIQAVLARAEANNTYLHGAIKRQYLLSRMVFCAGCGYAMFGGVSHKHGKGIKIVRYYRHVTLQKRRKRPCPFEGTGVKWVHADDLEEAVMRQLFELFGNPVAMQAAVERATPDAGKLEEARGRLAAVARELEKVKEGRARLVRMVARGTFREEDVDEQMAKLQERECRLQGESARLLGMLRTVPEPQVVRTRAAKIADYSLRMAMSYHLMTWDEKRALAQLVFGGKTADGRRMGVYLTPVVKGKRVARARWDYTLEGHLVDAIGRLPDVDTGEDPWMAPGYQGRQQDLLGATRTGSWW